MALEGKPGARRALWIGGAVVANRLEEPLPLAAVARSLGQ